MAGNSFGEAFRITTFGESHGGGVGVIIDGCPPGIAITEAEIQAELDRRKPGQSAITSPRKEADTITIYSGVFDGRTTGTPIMMMAANKDTRGQDYTNIQHVFRPGHADYTYLKKYGLRDYNGSGRASARETLARVAAGVLAQKILYTYHVRVYSYVESVGDIVAKTDPLSVTHEQIEQTVVRCPDPEAAEAMIAKIEEVRDEGDSIGGVIRGVITGLPVGLGEPVFDKFHADLGKAMLSINAVKGFDVGSGFDASRMRGSVHNDIFTTGPAGKISTLTNHAGGVLGGITNGSPVIFRVAFKPVSTLSREQPTVDEAGRPTSIAVTGRHDPCVLPRAVPIVDAMSALVALDHLMRATAQRLQMPEMTV